MPLAETGLRLSDNPSDNLADRCLVLTKDNTLLHIQASGSRYSRDFGSSWSVLKHAGPGGAVFTTQYYPRAVEAEDGTIVVTSHHGGDDAYMPRCESPAPPLNRSQVATAQRI